MKSTMKLLAATALTCLAFNAQAELVQDCVLEGKVIYSESLDLKQIIRVSFTSAQPFQADSHCNLRGNPKFSQPKGSMIENLPDGAKVQYHFQKDDQGNTQWRMIKAKM